MAGTGQTHESHRRPRTRPIGQRIAVLLTIPLLSLIALWAYSAVPALNDALERNQYAGNHDRVGQPINLALQAVQQERAAAIAALVTPSPANTQKFQEQIEKTDRAAAAFRESALSEDATAGRARERIQDTRNVGNQFDQLSSIRSQITSRNISALEAITAYSELFDTTVRLLSTLVTIDDLTAYQQTSGVLYMYWARDYMLRESLLLTSVRGDRLNAGTRAAFAQWAGARAELLDLGRIGLSGKVARTMGPLVDSPAFAEYAGLEDGVVQQGRAPDPQQWRAATEATDKLWLGTTFQAGEVIQHEEIAPASDRIMLRVYLAGGVGLAAVLLSIVLSLLFARSHAQELRRLQRSAQELANERLPSVVARLRRGQQVDLEAETPRPASGKSREVAQVSEAFDTVQRTAISTAIGEADLRASINRVFINLSWRSQSLLHRQLRLLDQMERSAASPEELDDLFRLDHLTTRMRRHAEGLVILAGSPTVRAWDHPVAAEDVVRAAIAEVEDYTRVEVTGASSAAVSGGVVADVIHLLAELIENAASFSPPTTEVTVKVESVANGLAVEVVDRGIGLAAEEREELNRRLASSVEFDLADTERLGLFVVARLAARHRIRVSLQPSVYGGTTAVVLIPHTLVVVDEEWRLTDGTGELLPQAAGATAAGGALRLGRPAPPAAPPAYPPPAHPPPAPPDGPLDAPAGGQNGERRRDDRHDGETGDAEDSEVTGRLPRRVRQRALAPQLRRSRVTAPSPPGSDADPDDDFDEPSPELSRDLMSSLQSGWLRGRDAEDTAGNDDPRDEWGES
ncbi:nitrate- and nitrite sensing domain-containing protein [Actinomadura sp. 6K520]|uniref:sensor histidine kinase n=1 Tax=Actinomadura sp. 6K520 TaxID=2530364 RepID=UPI0010510C8F|nr:nitrate- and nitrite sensing domain-containing protein [Actinomadura sp. 6K520]TDE26698.1 sensor histidine kinase [Actinomadura sp. 6K520]